MAVHKETHIATVSDTADPDQLGRIKVVCAALLGDEDQAIPMWIPMVPQWGWFSLPDVGEIVEIEVTTGTDDDEQFGQTSIDGLDIKYKCHRYYGGSDTDTPRSVPVEFKTNYGKRRGFATPKGHVFVFDDTDGSEEIFLKWKDFLGKTATLSIDSRGVVVIDASSVELNGTEQTLLGETFLDMFANHIHSSGLGPTGVPLPGSGGSLTPWSDALSVKVFSG